METTRRDALRLLVALGAAVPLAGCGDEQAPVRPGRTSLVASHVRRTPGDPALVPAAVAGMHALGAGVFGELPTDENIALSPFSIAEALAMVATGARGQTQGEMLDVLEADDVTRLDDGLNALAQHVEGLAGLQPGGKEVLLDVANTLFGQRGVTWERPFLRALARDFGAGLIEVDFAAPAPAAASINAWVADHTHGRITQIVSPDSLDELTRLVLVNALYFKAPWAAPFSDAYTKPRPFHLLDGSTVRVSMMKDTIDGAGTAAGEGWRSVLLPYAGGKLAMTVLLPDEGRDADLLALVADGDLPAVLRQAVIDDEVELSLPRWVLRSSFSLVEVLATLGMPTAFSSAADFTGMAALDLTLGDAQHATYVAVDEEGTEAAAATGIEVELDSARMPLSFVVDRPFVYCIHDLQHRTPLFIGRVVDPRG